MAGNEAAIPEHVRAHLLALGIPAFRHTPDALAGLFPREINIRDAGLSVEDLARVLVDLAGRGLVSVGADPGTSIRNVAPGWHFCQFYRDVQGLLDMVAPYIAQGLENGEGCLWVVPDAVTGESACGAIAEVVGGLDDYLASGQLEILSHRQWYLDPSGRLKSFEEIGAALFQRQDQALGKGYKMLRAAGDTGWVSGTEQSREFIDYEMKVSGVIGSTKVAAVCTYRADVTADELVSIVAAHQDAFTRS